MLEQLLEDKKKLTNELQDITTQMSVLSGKLAITNAAIKIADLAIEQELTAKPVTFRIPDTTLGPPPAMEEAKVFTSGVMGLEDLEVEITEEVPVGNIRPEAWQHRTLDIMALFAEQDRPLYTGSIVTVLFIEGGYDKSGTYRALSRLHKSGVLLRNKEEGDLGNTYWLNPALTKEHWLRIFKRREKVRLQGLP